MSKPDWLAAALSRTAQIAHTQSASALATSTVGSIVSTAVAPNDAIVLVQDEIGGQWWKGSGVLLSPDEVLTASHVVYHQDTFPSPTPTAIEVTVNSDTPNSQTSYTDGSAIHYLSIDDSNDKISLDASQSDYAIIHLTTPIYGHSTFDLLSNYGGGVATISGYPGTADTTLYSYTGNVSVDDSYTLLDSEALGPGSSGGPVWVTGADGQPYVVGVVSSYEPDYPTYGNDAQITDAAYRQIESWVAQDDGTTSPLAVVDTSLDQTSNPQGTVYSGPVANLDEQYIRVTFDNINITASTPNWFLHSGSGEDALNVSSGTNVLDGGTGSNFLVGGTGSDTFYTDDRGATTSIWDTVVDFHAGDSATLFGVTPADFTYTWVDDEGADGYKGLTLHATSPDHAEASVTLAGFDGRALDGNTLTISFGTTNGTPYLYIHDNG